MTDTDGALERCCGGFLSAAHHCGGGTSSAGRQLLVGFDGDGWVDHSDECQRVGSSRLNLLYWTTKGERQASVDFAGKMQRHHLIQPEMLEWRRLDGLTSPGATL